VTRAEIDRVEGAMNSAVRNWSAAGGGTLIYIGRPDKNGVSPQFDAAMVLYPPLILVFVVFGCMALLSSP
jgi:hypothetical protein